jgi:hypothetical protein
MVEEGILITLRYQPTNPEPLSVRTPGVNNVELSGINIRGAKRPIAIYGLEEKDISEISFNDIRISSDRGILLENTSGISFHDIKMDIKQGSPLEARDSKNITWDLVSVAVPVKDQPFLKLINCRNVRVTNCFQPDFNSFYVSGDDNCSDIYIVNNIFPRASTLYNKKGKNIVVQNNTIGNDIIPLTN